MTNLCWFKSDLPTLILVRSTFEILYPREKNLNLGGFSDNFVNILKSCKSLHWFSLPIEFQSFEKYGKNDYEKIVL